VVGLRILGAGHAVTLAMTADNDPLRYPIAAALNL
jgi:hypothetical protein